MSAMSLHESLPTPFLPKTDAHEDFHRECFSLPVAKVYSATPNARARAPGIAVSKKGSHVLDVLESQDGSAFLPNALISFILSQFSVNVAYESMLCKDVIPDLVDRYGWVGVPLSIKRSFERSQREI
ncbi:hypothetical protein KIN20_018532 [Parelaphostrongylus tenuis]|uniref:Uncharacterized protein n=1 Tax=Parelaphostrongylus tenuis TaxID=148309 RepID=A0AAD5QUE2_PARTN|nr:hypothetical protein KIN20_018532 [Parelaphostrongylus tenuis]